MFIPAVGCPPATPSGQPTAGIRAARSQLLPGLAQSKSTKHRFKTKRSQPFLGNDTFENAQIVNKGETNFKELSHTELQASFHQTAGKLNVAAGAEVLSGKSLEVTGGSMNIAGALTSNTLVVQNAEAIVAGSLKAGSLTLGTKNKGLSQTTFSLTNLKVG